MASRELGRDKRQAALGFDPGRYGDEVHGHGFQHRARTAAFQEGHDGDGHRQQPQRRQGDGKGGGEQRLVAGELIDQHHLVRQGEHAAGDEGGVRDREAAVARQGAEAEPRRKQQRRRHRDDEAQAPGKGADL